jgi:alpha-tubulin suppressor-like RCC1 family protein
MVTAGRYAALAASCLLLGACASRGETPSLPWLIAANIRSLAGIPPTPPSFCKEPIRVSETLKFTAITAGLEHTCAVDIDGDTYCWGSNQYRQLGDAELTETCGNGTFACSSTPVRLEDAPRFTALAASMWGTCGLDGAGAALCWGFGHGGQRADSGPGSSGVPVEVPGGRRFVALDSSPAGHRTCGLTADGRVWCWGFEPPAGGGPHVFIGPDPVSASSNFLSIDVGGQHGCGIDAARNVFCWGGNMFGQLGAGASALEGGIRESRVPVEVQGGLEPDPR